MSALSSRAEGAIAAFAGSLGLPLRAGRDGAYTFVFDRSGTLSLTPSKDGTWLVVSLTRAADRFGPAGERAALEAAGLDPTSSRFIHAGLSRDGATVLAIGLDEPSLSLPVLDECFRSLVARFDMMAGR